MHGTIMILLWKQHHDSFMHWICVFFASRTSNKQTTWVHTTIMVLLWSTIVAVLCTEASFLLVLIASQPQCKKLSWFVGARWWRKQALLRRAHQPRGRTSFLANTGNKTGVLLASVRLVVGSKGAAMRQKRSACPQKAVGSCAGNPAVTPTFWASTCTFSVHPSLASWRSPPPGRALRSARQERTCTPLGSEKDAQSC